MSKPLTPDEVLPPEQRPRGRSAPAPEPPRAPPAAPSQGMDPFTGGLVLVGVALVSSLIQKAGLGLPTAEPPAAPRATSRKPTQRWKNLR